MRRKPHLLQDLDPKLRSRVAVYLRRSRAKDREELSQANWMDQGRSLEDYCRRLGILKDYFLALVQLRAAERGNVGILDIGMGKGEALRDLKSLFPDVRVSGLRLTFRHFTDLKDLDLRVGPIEALALNAKTYDFILSVRGGMAYTLNSFSAVQEALNALRSGGMAFFEDGRLLWTQLWFRDFLKSKSFEVDVTRYQESAPAAYKIKKLSETSLDLTPFSRRYLELLGGHREVFLKWGFDRLEPGSPLNDLYQGLYSRKNYEEFLL